MALKRTPRPVDSVEFTVAGANNGDYGVLIVGEGKQGVTIGVEGTAGSATVNIGKTSGGSIVNYENSTMAPGEQLSVYAGAKQSVYVIIAASTSTTNLIITGNVW